MNVQILEVIADKVESQGPYIVLDFGGDLVTLSYEKWLDYSNNFSNQAEFVQYASEVGCVFKDELIASCGV